MIENAQLACRLARYGYDHKSPTALVEAARILTDQPFHEAEVVQKQPSRGSEGRKHTRPMEMDVEKLLADARAFCVLFRTSTTSTGKSASLSTISFP